ncbi:MAG: FHA domain-containing protein [Archangium sp.]
MSTVTIAPHLHRALEAMSKDMAVEPQALVNQAVFAWLRINGYVTPGTAAALSHPVAPPPQVEPVSSTPTPAPIEEVAQAFTHTPVEESPQLMAVAAATPLPEAEPEREPEPEPQPEPEPVAAPVVEAAKPQQKRPGVDPRPRMQAIDHDLAKLTRPWRAWTNEPEVEEEEEAAPPSSPEEEALDDALAAAADEAVDTDRHPSSREEEPPPPDEPTGTGAQSLVDEEPMDGNTGETNLEEPHESTVVFSSSSIALFIERDGQDPVQVTVARFIIGRGPQCDLIIDSPRVSREHAAITREGVTWVLEDLNSSNGTWLGEDRVTRRELESGDVINLGNEPVTFVLRAG